MRIILLHLVVEQTTNTVNITLGCEKWIRITHFLDNYRLNNEDYTTIMSCSGLNKLP